MLTFVLSTIGIALTLTGALVVRSDILPWLIASVALWLSMFALSGWINSGSGATGPVRRLWDVIAAVLLAFVTSAVAIGVQVVALVKGNPHRFEVIQKTDPKAKKASLATLPDPGSSAHSDATVVLPEPETSDEVEPVPDLSTDAADGR